MWYNYILLSLKDNDLYTGCTNNLQTRVKTHNSGGVPSTNNRRPLKLIYCEACISQDDAYRREKYLKSGYGKRYLKSRLRIYFGK